MGFWGKPKLNAMQLGFALGEGLDVWVSQTPAFGNFRPTCRVSEVRKDCHCGADLCRHCGSPPYRSM
jgi:hypothetical protein